MIGQYSLEQIYFIVLLICAGLAVFLFIFGDIFSFDGPIDPMLIVPWFAFTALIGYLGEQLTEVNSWLILLIGFAMSTIIVFVLNFYLLVPLRNADATISISEKDMEGRTAVVTTPIPIKGMGEIKFSSVTGSLTRPASFYEVQKKPLKNGEKVLIIEIRERVCYVVPYEENFLL